MNGPIQFVVLLVVISATTGQFTLQLLDLEQYPMATCLDGSPGGFYFAPGSGSGSSSWMVHFQGGGWCINDNDCLGRSKTALGSSRGWGTGGCPNASSPVCYADGGAGGMLSSNPAVNPDLYNWNKVFINYCDGGSYSGSLSTPVSVNGQTIYYRGRYILDAVYDQLYALGLKRAKTVVVKGCSAGGLAAYLHADYIRARVAAVNPAARVLAAPGAGFFLDVASYAGPHIYTPNYQWVFEAMNASGSVNDACVASYGPAGQAWKCFIAPYVLPFIKTPLFVSNSLGDQWQLYNIMNLGCNPPDNNCNASQLAYFNNFRVQMIGLLAPVLESPANGAFLQECCVHVVEDVDGSWNGVLVQNQTQAQTFGAWLNDSTSFSSKAVDGPWNTNPTCARYGPEPKYY
eukprot:TRINITY_DN12574_c0_g1_i1.p1 TRINITY_DN12574_c0_g1~~TRINITY_DN12574_c0_g1_i1.p1  ORF type:complete len:428 (-),score=116.14 TRINITY_DN12574_c0_g1_i1:145-1350(-)